MISRFFLILLITVVLLFPIWALGTEHGQVKVRSVFFITQVLPQLPSIKLGQSNPIVSNEKFNIGSDDVTVQIYKPNLNGKHPGIILFLGVSPAANHDPRIVNLASALTRTGFVTLIYSSQEIAEGNLNFDDVQKLVGVFKHMQSMEYVDKDRIGFAGFCVGGSYVLMAASQPEINDDVAFVNVFASYFNAESLVRSIATTSFWNGEEYIKWTPDELTMKTHQEMLLESITLEDKIIVQNMMSTNGFVFESEDDYTQTVYKLLTGVTNEEYDSLYDSLPLSMKEKYEEISPSTYITNLRSPVYIMHDKKDDMIPYIQSKDLYETLLNKVDVNYTEFQLFRHLDPDREISPVNMIIEIKKLYEVINSIIKHSI